MKLSDEELNKIMMKADDDLDKLKDRCHELYEENERLKIQVSAREELYEYSQLRIDKAFEYIDKQKTKMYKSRNKIAMYVLMKVEDILKGDDK